MDEHLKAQVREQIELAIQVAGSASELARRLGVTTQAVCFWRDGKRKIPESLGARIWVATDGKVTRQRLWPNDWWIIWPELVEKPVASEAAPGEAAHA